MVATQIFRQQRVYYLYQTVMKILLKGKEAAKLYKGELDMSSLTKFIASNLKMEPLHYTLTYKDDEGDEISIVSDADLQTAQELNQGKNFLKINLKSNETMLVTSPDLKKESPKKEEKEKMREERKLKREERRKTREAKDNSSEEKKDDSRGKCLRRLAKFTRMLSRSISEQVDEQVTLLMPGVIKQAQENIKEIPEEGAVLHAETECQGNVIGPVEGVRYKCSIGIDFNLSQNTQEGDKKDFKPLPWLFKMLDQGWDKSGQKPWKRRSHSRCKRSPEALERMFFEKKCRKLSKIYGGEPEQYREFVESNRDLKIGETMQKYAELHQDEKAQAKLIAFRAEKLAKWFDKSPDNYTEFVKQNMTIKPRELFRKLIETGAEEKPVRSPRKGDRPRRFSKEKTEEPRLSKEEREERRASRQAKREERKQKKESLEKEGSTERPEKKEKKFSPMKMKEGGQLKGRGKLIQTMIDLFGRQGIKDYLRLIEEHGSEGQERLVELYIEQLAKQE